MCIRWFVTQYEYSLKHRYGTAKFNQICIRHSSSQHATLTGISRHTEGNTTQIRVWSRSGSVRVRGTRKQQIRHMTTRTGGGGGCICHTGSFDTQRLLYAPPHSEGVRLAHSSCSI